VRIPAARVYRAFPELDDLTDAECELLLQRASRRKPVAAAGRALALLGVWMCSTVALGLVGFRVSVLMAPQWPDNLLSVVLVQSAFIGCGLLPALLVRDALVRRLLRREIADAACLVCGYPLRGLPTAEGIVRCPECGKVTRSERWNPRPEASEPAEEPAPIGAP